MRASGERGRLVIALLISALVHLLAGGGLPWPTPWVPPMPAPPITARLTPPPASIPSPVPSPQPERPSQEEPRPPARPAPPPPAAPAPGPSVEPPHTVEAKAVPNVPASPETPPPGPTVTETAEAHAGTAAPLPEAERPNVPKGFAIRFAVQGSEGGFPLGRIEHVWQSDGIRYTLSAVTQASGLMRLFYSGLLTQTSEGEITAAGLRPSSYSYQSDRRQLHAQFDWDRQVADLGPQRPPLALPPGAQDLLSVLYQVSLFPPPATGRIWVVDGKRLRLYHYRELGREVLKLPLGRVATRHLRVQEDSAEEAIELWLQEGYLQLPVKIRMLGHRQGDAVLTAESIQGLGEAAGEATAD